MIIGKFLDPRAPSLPQQVGINTDDIAEILQENEEQSANIQQNTDDIELLKQQVSESGTRVRVDGELVAEWSPDELTDDLQQLRLAQSSDSLAIVGLQSDNITNKNNIAKLDAETLKTPILPPANIELVGIGTNNAQANIKLSDNFVIENGELKVKNEIIYFKNSQDANINKGYTSGIKSNTWSAFEVPAKFNKIFVYAYLSGKVASFEIDLTLLKNGENTEITATGFAKNQNNSGNNAYILYGFNVTIRDNLQFTAREAFTYNGIADSYTSITQSDENFYIYKVEGIL